MDRHVHRGSAPRVSHPLGGFLAGPGPRPSTRSSPSKPTCRYRAGSRLPFRVPLAGIARLSRGRWLPRRSVGAAFECDPSCPDSLDFPRRPRPSGPPPPEAPSLTSCVFERGRPRRSGRSPSRARITFHQEPKLQDPRHPQARRSVLTLASLRRPRSVLPPACPTPFPGVLTSVSVGADAPPSTAQPVRGSWPSWGPPLQSVVPAQASGPD
jgi:hypothetical protein